MKFIQNVIFRCCIHFQLMFMRAHWFQRALYPKRHRLAQNSMFTNQKESVKQSFVNRSVLNMKYFILIMTESDHWIYAQLVYTYHAIRNRFLSWSKKKYNIWDIQSSVFDLGFIGADIVVVKYEGLEGGQTFINGWKPNIQLIWAMVNE